MQAFLFTAAAYVVLPIITLYSLFAAIYLFDVRDPEFLSYLILWVPGIFLYYIYISQLIIGQRLPFLDRIWGFPNLIRKHRGLFRYLFLVTLVMHSLAHLRRDGADKLIFHPDSGMIVAYVAVIASMVLMGVAAKVWLKPHLDKTRRAVSYAKMHRLHQLFYVLAIGVWYHVVSSGAFQGNLFGTVLVTSYLLFALLCKLYMTIARLRAPVYRLEKLEVLHENFVRLRFCAAQIGHRVRALHRHKAGQYAYFSFATKNKRGKTYWEQHPFSFAGFAPQDSTENVSVLTVVVKKLGDFTARLQEFPTWESGTEVKVMGPYGTFARENSAYSDGVHLVAAGAGITPFLSILEQKSFDAEQDKIQRPLALHWFVRDESELVFEDRFQYFREKLPNLMVQTYVGQSLSEGILQQVLSSMSVGRRLGVLYCGPGAVGPAVRKAMSELGIPRRNFHTELFSM